jgi:hypothetical protein
MERPLNEFAHPPNAGTVFFTFRNVNVVDKILVTL